MGNLIQGLRQNSQGGLRQGLNNTVLEGSSFSGGGTSGYTGAVDATSGWAVPASQADWTSLLAGTGIANPFFGWDCQALSGNLTDFLGGGVTSTETPALPLYQRVVAGWTRKSVQTEGGPVYIRSTSAALPDLSTTSFLVLAITQIPAAQAADANGVKSVMTIGPVFGQQAAFDLTCPTTGSASTSCTILLDNNGGGGSGGNTVVGSLNASITVQPVFLGYNKTTNLSTLVSSTDALSRAPTTAFNGKALYLGGDNAQTFNSAGNWFLYVCGWAAAAAEMTIAQQQQVVALIRQGH